MTSQNKNIPYLRAW